MADPLEALADRLADALHGLSRGAADPLAEIDDAAADLHGRVGQAERVDRTAETRDQFARAFDRELLDDGTLKAYIKMNKLEVRRGRERRTIFSV